METSENASTISDEESATPPVWPTSSFSSSSSSSSSSSWSIMLERNDSSVSLLLFCIATLLAPLSGRIRILIVGTFLGDSSSSVPLSSISSSFGGAMAGAASEVLLVAFVKASWLSCSSLTEHGLRFAASSMSLASSAPSTAGTSSVFSSSLSICSSLLRAGAASGSGGFVFLATVGGEGRGAGAEVLSTFSSSSSSDEEDS